jgi:hypothetical protein
VAIEQKQISQNAADIERVDLNMTTKSIDSGFSTRKFKHRWLVTGRVQSCNKLNTIEPRSPALEPSLTGRNAVAAEVDFKMTKWLGWSRNGHHANRQLAGGHQHVE